MVYKVLEAIDDSTEAAMAKPVRVKKLKSKQEDKI